MNFDFKILLFVLIFFNKFHITFSEKYLDLLNKSILQPLPDFDEICLVLQNIISVYFVKEKSPFDIIIFEPISRDYSDILGQLSAYNNEQFSFKIIKFNNLKFKQPIFLNNSALFIVSDNNSLVDIFRYFQAIRYQNQAMKYFIYFTDATFDDIRDFWLIQKHEMLTLETGSIFYYSYFVIT